MESIDIINRSVENLITQLSQGIELADSWRTQQVELEATRDVANIYDLSEYYSSRRFPEVVSLAERLDTTTQVKQGYNVFYTIRGENEGCHNWCYYCMCNNVICREHQRLVDQDSTNKLIDTARSGVSVLR